MGVKFSALTELWVVAASVYHPRPRNYGRRRAKGLPNEQEGRFGIASNP